MKKIIISIITLLLAVVLLPLADANAKVAGTLGEEGKDFYEIESSGAILDLQFDGEGKWGDKNGLYAPNCYEEDGKLVYSGLASWTKYMVINPNEAYKNAVLIVDVVAELIGVREFYASAFQDYDNGNAYPSIIRESGIMNIQYDENGKFVSGDKRVGWLGGSDDCTKDVFEATAEGYLHMQFVVCTNAKGIAEIGFEIVGYDTANATVKVDSLQIFKAEYKAVYDHTFDGEGTWGDKEGLYSPNTTEEGGQLVFNTTDAGAQFAWVKANDAYKNKILVVESVVELNAVSSFYFSTRQDWNGNAYPSILRDTGIQNIQYDENGKMTGFDMRPGWLYDWNNAKYTDDPNRDILSITEDGKLYMRHVAFVGEAGIAEINFTIEGAAGVAKSAKLDYLKMSVCEFPTGESTYYTYAWNTTMEDLDTNAQPWDNQPIWANTMAWETEYPLDGTHSIKISGSAGNDPVWGVQIGGFDTANPAKALLKQAGLHYIQMDVDCPDFEWFNIWTSGTDYYAVKYHMTDGWTTEGKVQNFKAVDLGNCYRISYYVDYVDPATPHNINVFNGSGSIYFDNLVVAYVDNAPFVASSHYDLIDTQDVEVAVDLKGAAFVALKDALDNVVDSSLYTLVDGVLTLKKELFASATDSYAFKLESSAGVKEFVVSKNDNRTVISGVNATISKVYDGTTSVDMSSVVLTLVGVAEGDDVAVTCQLAYSSADAANGINMIVTDLALTGNDAYKYVLPEEVVLTGDISKKVVEVVANAASKTEGEADPELTYTVSGLLEGDVLTGALTRTSGEEAGTYDIELGTLAASANYEINYTKAQLTINEKPADDTPTDPGQDEPTDTPTNPGQDEPTDTPTDPGQSEPAPAPSIFGCSGSVISSIFGLLALVGGVVVLRKKREE